MPRTGYFPTAAKTGGREEHHSSSSTYIHSIYCLMQPCTVWSLWQCIVSSAAAKFWGFSAREGGNTIALLSPLTLPRLSLPGALLGVILLYPASVVGMDSAKTTSREDPGTPL